MAADWSHRVAAHVETALLVDPLHLLVGQEDRGEGRGVVGLVLAAVLEGDPEVEGRGDPALRCRDPCDAVDGRGRGRREPEATVGGQALLRGEVVDVDLARLEAQTAGRRGGVDDDEPVGTGGPLQRHGHTGGGLVVGEAVGVDLGVGHRERVRPRIGEQVGRLVEVRRGGGDLRELGRELAEAEVLAPPIDEPERGGVPEGGGPAVAEQHLVAVGQGEELGQAVAERPDLELHPRLPVGGAEVVAARCGQRLDGLGADLRGPAAEAPVGGQQVDGDLDVGERGGHLAMMAERTRAQRPGSEGPSETISHGALSHDVPPWPTPSRPRGARVAHPPHPRSRQPARGRHRRVRHARGRRQGQGAQGRRRAGHRLRRRRARLPDPGPHRGGGGGGGPRPEEPQVHAGRRPPRAEGGDRRQDAARLRARRDRPARCSSPTGASTPSTTPSPRCSTPATRCSCRRPTGPPTQSRSRSRAAYRSCSTPTR